jgi:Nuclear transport factor 2 (NTF2) domain
LNFLLYQGINQKIMSMDVSNYFWEIETADAQPSYMNGVFIVVTGCLTGPDRIRRNFAQSFFLAPQDANGYFVLNDVLRIAIDRTGVVPVMANGSILVPGGCAIPLQANNVIPAQANVVPLQSDGNVPVPSDDPVSVSANGAGVGDNSQASVTTLESGQYY